MLERSRFIIWTTINKAGLTNSSQTLSASIVSSNTKRILGPFPFAHDPVITHRLMGATSPTVYAYLPVSRGGGGPFLRDRIQVRHVGHHLHRQPPREEEAEGSRILCVQKRVASDQAV